MEKNLETESKVLLNSEDYNIIYDYFNLEKAKPIKQVNYYFDTIKFSLKDNGYNMRVRHVLNDDSYTLTVKIPYKESHIEINQEITYDEFVDFVEKCKIPEGYIKEKVDEFNKEPVILLTKLITTRYEFEYEQGLIALDYNEYNNLFDYELEYEGKSMDYCKSVISRLLNRLNIEFEFSKESKRKRAIQSIL